MERKYIWHEVLPDLQNHCLQYGVDISFVDMLLGNTENCMRCMKNLETSINEIAECEKDSIGPFFLVRTKYSPFYSSQDLLFYLL